MSAIIAAVASAIIGGAISAASQNAANSANQELNEENRQWQSEEAEKARQWQESMWNKTNEYNSPANQLQRLRDANINPLAGEMANSVANNVSPSSVPSAPSAIPSQSILNNLGNLGLQASQIANINAQTNKIAKDTEAAEIENYVNELTKDEKVETIKWNRQLADYMTMNAYQDALFKETSFEARLKKAMSDAGLAEAEEKIAGVTLLFHSDKLAAEIHKIESEGKLNDQEYAIKEMTKYLSEQYGFDAKANNVYNIANMLLNPVVREKIASQMGILDFLKDKF